MTMPRSRYHKFFDTTTKVSEFLAAMRVCTKEIKLPDCDMLPADSETEKAWMFDFKKIYEDGKCSRRFYYVPKSQCKVLENDYYINEDGSLITDVHFILMPKWLASKVGA